MTRLAFTPTRPGALLAAAAARRTACPLTLTPCSLRRRGTARRRSDVVGWRGGDGRRAAAEPTAPTATGAAAAARRPGRGRAGGVGVVVVATDRVSQPEPEPLGPAAGAWTLVPHTGLGAWVDVYDWTLELGRPGAVGGRRRRGRHGRGRRADALHPDRPHALGHARGDGAGAPRADHPARPQPPDARGGVVPPHLRGRRRRPAAAHRVGRPRRRRAGRGHRVDRDRRRRRAQPSPARPLGAPPRRRRTRTRRWRPSRRRPCTSRW